MTYFRMLLLSHGSGPLAPGHMAMPRPGCITIAVLALGSLRADRAFRRV